MGNEENDMISSSKDQKPEKKPGGWKSIKYILGNESFEKLASISLLVNIAVYLSTKYNMSGIFLVTVVNVWGGFCNISSLGGAFVSDAYLGKFYTLLLGSLASLTGMGIMTLTAWISVLRPNPCNLLTDPECSNSPEPWQLAVLFAGLGLLAIGAGGIRPCNIAFGADQFDTKTPKGKAQLESFFNWWYFSFTVALVIAITGVVYVQTNVSWALGFAIPTACLAFSITIFLIGQHTYVKVKPQGSVFSDIFKVIVAAIRKRHVAINSEKESFFDPAPEGSVAKLPRTDRFRFLDKAAVIVSADEVKELEFAKDTWRLCSVQQVEQLKCLVAVLPVAISGIGALMVMDQNNTFAILQALQMRREFGSFTVPPGWVNLASMVALSLWIYSYERLYVRDRKDKRLSIRQRITIGIILSILSMATAGIVESCRRSAALKSGTYISPASVAWLVPQFVLTGLTEALAAVAVLEFLTTKLSESMRTVAGAIFYLCLSIAGYSGSVLVNLTHLVTGKTGKTAWLGGHDLNKNRLDYYYFFLTSLTVLNLLYFHFFATRYLLNTTSPPTSDDQQRNDDDDDDQSTVV